MSPIAAIVSVAKWIMRLPSKQKVLGSIPSVDIFFARIFENSQPGLSNTPIFSFHLFLDLEQSLINFCNTRKDS